MRASFSAIAFCVPQNSQRSSRVPGANESFAPQPPQGKVLTKTGDRPRFSELSVMSVMRPPEKTWSVPGFLLRHRRRNVGEEWSELRHLARLGPLRHSRLPHQRIARELPRGCLALERAEIE